MWFERMCYSLVPEVDTNSYLNLQVDTVVLQHVALLQQRLLPRLSEDKVVVKFAKLRLLARHLVVVRCSSVSSESEMSLPQFLRSPQSEDWVSELFVASLPTLTSSLIQLLYLE